MARRDGRTSSYQLTLGITSALAAFLAFFAILFARHHEVTSLLHQRQSLSLPPGGDTLSALLPLVLGPLMAAAVSYIVMAQMVTLLRIAVYVRAVHQYTFQQLQRSAPLHALRAEPVALRVAADGRPHDDEGAPVSQALLRGNSTLLIGAPGAGKTIALLTVAHELSRKQLIWRIARNRAPLPVIVPLAGISHASESTGKPLVDYSASLIRGLGTAGLANRLSHLLHAGNVVLLCDGLDEVPVRDRPAVAQMLATLASNDYAGTRIITTYDLEAYLEMPQTVEPLRSLERLLLTDVSAHDIARVLRYRPVRVPLMRHDDATFTEELRAHRLETSVRVAALLAALLDIRQSAELPFGRAELLNATTELLARRDVSDTLVPERMLLLLGALASSLRASGSRVVPLQAGEQPGSAVLRWLSEHAPFGPVERQMSEPIEVTVEEAEAICMSAIMSGMLIRRVDGCSLVFANRLLEASFAARHLSLLDDDMGSLKADLLRPRWTLPMLLWAGTARDPGIVARRVLRLAHTPDLTATTAGLRSRNEASAGAYALALAALIEGGAAILARETSAPASASVFQSDVAPSLRDLLDGIHDLLPVPERRTAIREALRAIALRSGDEYLDNIGYLIRSPRWDRLARAELTTVLGLLATPAALALLMDLLTETDPTMRQAVTRSIMLAGTAALAPLRALLSSDDERLRTRALEVFALFGPEAVDAAAAALHSTEPAERAAAARALGALRAADLVDALLLCLRDPLTEVRVASTEALGQIATPPALTALLGVTTDSDVLVREAVATALGATHQTEALAGLLRLLGDDVASVRAAAAAALGVLGDLRARALLQAHNGDPDARVQRAASSALRRLTYS